MTIPLFSNFFLLIQTPKNNPSIKPSRCKHFVSIKYKRRNRCMLWKIAMYFLTALITNKNRTIWISYCYHLFIKFNTAYFMSWNFFFFKFLKTLGINKQAWISSTNPYWSLNWLKCCNVFISFKVTYNFLSFNKVNAVLNCY